MDARWYMIGVTMSVLGVSLGAPRAQSSPAPTAAQLSSAAAAATTSALAKVSSAVLNAGNSGMVCDGDTTLQSDGNTADTDGLISAIITASSLPLGAEIVLPPGQCEINETIDIPVGASMRISGAGIGLTTLQFFTPAGVSTPVGSGLVFIVYNDSNLTVDDFTIDRRLGANLGTDFIGTAIDIVASSIRSQADTVTTTNLDIYPASPSGQTDSWNTGLSETNISGPLIDNVTVNLPGWSSLPDPGAYECGASGTQVPCAIHTLPSPANPVSTPPNLGFGTATGVALEGSGSGNFAIDSVIEGLTVNGGLVGLDLAQFQGAYVTDSNFTASVYGIRADTIGTVSELLSVANSLFASTVSGIYTNGVGGMQVTGNSFSPTDTGTTNLPSWSAVWARNDNNDTISANNIIGSATAVDPEYGIYESADSPNGFPVSITGNTIGNLSSPGSVCLGNNANISSVNATGNTLTNCASYLADANGNNGYADNSFQTPDETDNGNDQVQFAKGITIGNFANAGSLQIVTDGVQQFLVNSSGSVQANGSVQAGGSISAGGTVTGSSLISAGPIVMSGSPSHNAAQEVVGNFYFPAAGNSPTIALTAPAGGLPPFTGGLATIFGELTCSSAASRISWHFDGHYTMSGTTLVPGAFAATVEGDADSQAAVKLLTGGNSVTPIASPVTPGLEVEFGSGVSTTFDCTALLTDMIEN